MVMARFAHLGIALRAPIGRPPSVKLLEPESYGLQALPSLVFLHRSDRDIGATGCLLAAIIGLALCEALPSEWMMRS
jgi:hypothetical protein